MCLHSDIVRRQQTVLERNLDNKEELASAHKLLKEPSRDSSFVICYICNATFDNKTLLISHIKTHKPLKTGNCVAQHSSLEEQNNICDSKEISQSIKSNGSLYKASENGPTEENGTNSVQKPIKTELLKCCTICTQEYESQAFLKRHIARVHRKETIEKLNCSNTSSAAVPRKSMRRLTFTCEHCPTTFKSSRKLVQHARSEHELDSKSVKPFGCDECDRKFRNSSNLLQHKKYHEGKRSSVCSFCGKGFITKSDLLIHEKQHLNKREYSCELCPKNFNTHKDLRSHKLVVHTEPSTWNHLCESCDKRFPIKSNYDQHMRRHRGDKRFGCHICEKRFIDKVVLQKHILSHSNVRAFKCEHCLKEYKEKRVLEVHLTKVHGIGNAKIPVRVKKYFCHICPKSYFAKNKLTRHMFTHSGERPFGCSVCKKRFTDKSYVKQHLRNAHNIFEAQENR